MDIAMLSAARSTGKVVTLVCLAVLLSAARGQNPTIMPEDFFVLNANVTLLCEIKTAESNPKGKFPLTWSRKSARDKVLQPALEQVNRLAGPFRQYFSSLVMTVKADMNNDEFICTARFGETVKRAHYGVRVLPPRVPFIYVKEPLVVEAETILSCWATLESVRTGGRSVLVWSRASNPKKVLSNANETYLPVGMRFRVYTSNLRLRVEKSMNLDEIICSVQAGDMRMSGKHLLRVIVPPKTLLISGPRQIVSGKKTKWNCEVKGAGHSPPRLFWVFSNGTRMAYRDSKTAALRGYENSKKKAASRRTLGNGTLSDYGDSKIVDWTFGNGTRVGNRASEYGVLDVRIILGNSTRVGYGTSENDGQDLRRALRSYADPDRHAYLPRGAVQTLYDLSVSLSLTPPVNYDDINFTLSCIVSHNASQIVKVSSITVTVRQPPMVMSDGIHLANLDQPISIRCLFLSKSKVISVTWYKNGFPLANSSRYEIGSLADPKLTIRQAGERDSGNFTCEVANKNGEGRSNGSQVFVGRYLWTTCNTTVVEDSNVTCLCQTNLSDVTLSWPGYSKSAVLTLNNIDKYHSGNVFVCQGIREADKVLLVKHTMRVKPKLTQRPPVVHKSNVGQNITVGCDNDNPDADVVSIAWSKNDEPLTFNPSRYIRGTATNESLLIKEAKEDDSGTYKCTVTYTDGTKTENPTQVIIGEYVWTNCPASIEEGRGFACECLADWSDAVLTWPGHSNTSILTVDEVSVQDSGTRYMCEAKRVSETMFAHFILKVTHKEKRTNDSDRWAPVPEEKLDQGSNAPSADGVNAGAILINSTFVIAIILLVGLFWCIRRWRRIA